MFELGMLDLICNTWLNLRDKDTFVLLDDSFHRYVSVIIQVTRM